MRPWFALASLALSLVGSGCSLVQDATRNIVVSVRAPIDAHHEKTRNWHWAEAAWQSVAATRAASYSRDYAQGFKDGYAEYLFRGGDGDLPLAPPLSYRNIRYQTPEGYSAIQDWFNGYRHGSSVARDSGARTWITGPSALKSALSVLPGPPPAESGPLQETLPKPIPPPAPHVVPGVTPTSGQTKVSGTEANSRPSEWLDVVRHGSKVALEWVDVAPMPPVESEPVHEATRARITGVREAPVPIRARIVGVTVERN
jgi:hypothetical protein